MFEFQEGTYEELFRALELMSEESRKKKIQVVPNNPNKDVSVGTLPVYAIGTVEELEIEIRSCYDAKNHLDDIVLISDDHPFAEDGAFAYDLQTADPLYGKNERSFSSQELIFLSSLGFVAKENNTLVRSHAVSRMSVTIQDDGLIILAVKKNLPFVDGVGAADIVVNEFKSFYRFAHHVLSLLEG
jgi:hypothetical protein